MLAAQIVHCSPFLSQTKIYHCQVGAHEKDNALHHTMLITSPSETTSKTRRHQGSRQGGNMGDPVHQEPVFAHCHSVNESSALCASSRIISATSLVRGFNSHLNATGLRVTLLVEASGSGYMGFPDSSSAGLKSNAHSILSGSVRWYSREGSISCREEDPERTHRDITINRLCNATACPGQIRLPKPKGRLKSTSRGSVAFRKRSGSKVSGSAKSSGSCEMVLSTVRVSQRAATQICVNTESQ